MMDKKEKDESELRELQARYDEEQNAIKQRELDELDKV